MSTMKVGDQMTKYPFIADLDMRVSEAFRIMHEAHIRHLPVVNADKVVGLISDRSLRMAFSLPSDGDLRVRDILVKNPYKVAQGTSLAAVAKAMADNKYGCVIIEDTQKRAVGIFTTTDGMRVLSDLLLREDDDFSKRSIDEFAFPLHLAVV